MKYAIQYSAFQYYTCVLLSALKFFEVFIYTFICEGTELLMAKIYIEIYVVKIQTRRIKLIYTNHSGCTISGLIHSKTEAMGSNISLSLAIWPWFSRVIEAW